MLSHVLKRARLPVARAVFVARLSLARRPTLAIWLRQRAMRRLAAGDPQVIQLVTVAFNNPLVIALQDDHLQANLTDRYRWTVADNSPRRDARCALRNVCRERGIPYVRLPRNPYTGRDPSRSHAEALNYVTRRYAAELPAPVVGFLDHDVFPMRPTSVVERMGAAVVYGRAQERAGVSYLWPGLLFVRPDGIDLRALDFHPWQGGDTGAGLYPTLLRRLRPDQVTLTGTESHRFRKDTERYEIFDDWVHTMNASYWKEAAPKEAEVVELLKRIAVRGSDQGTDPRP